jgi:hypothetical protein
MDVGLIIIVVVGVLMFLAYLGGIYYTSYKDYSKKNKEN